MIFQFTIACFNLPTKDEDGSLPHVLYCVECIDDQKKREDKLLYLAQTDIMTGISNRRSGEKMIERVLNNKVSGMLCLVDCDKFKSINDTYGHMAVMRSLLRLRIRYKNRVVIKM